MKIAIVHDWLVTYAGAERVLEQMLNCYPSADLYAVVDHLDKDKRGFIQNKSVTTSFIQKLPFSRTKYRSYLPLMPLAIEQLNLSAYDLILSSSHAVAKGVLTGPDQLHICMCYSPIRYAWDLQHQYLEETGLDKGIKGFFTKYLLHKIRLWDHRTANGVDKFIGISDFICRRIMKVYGRNSKTIYPSVDTHKFSPSISSNKNERELYITCSRMVPYKKIDVIVEAFTKHLPNKKLIVIGDGPDFKKIDKLAKGNVDLLGFREFDVLKCYLQNARAFVFASEEDFGIAPLEAQACGIPVIAFGKGGALETVNGLDSSRPTGTFFYEQTPRAVADAVIEFEENLGLIASEDCVKNAERFSVLRFQSEFKEFVYRNYQQFLSEGKT